MRGLPLVAALAVLSSPAAALVAGHPVSGFAVGFAHPFSGLDDMLAMVALGLWAAQLGRPAIWVFPAVFPAAMAAGALLALGGVPIARTEFGIAMSLAGLGAAVAFAARPALAVAAALTALFAIFHGHRHGAELPAASPALAYGLGFLLGTLMLHGAGIGLGLLTHGQNRRFYARTAGASVAALGVPLAFAG